MSRDGKNLTPSDLFVVKEHANISANSPGLGPNINEYGPRFYDITHMYEHSVTEILLNITKEKSINHGFGEIFWINNTALPDIAVFKKMAEGLSNDRVNF